MADLKAEIGPRKFIDLTKIADQSAIEKSRDLKLALNSKKLALTRHSLVQVKTALKETLPTSTEITKVVEKTVIEKIVEKNPSIDEDKLTDLIQKAITSTLNQQNKTIESGFSGIMSSIRNQIINAQSSPMQQSKHIETEIDPAKIAEISQKSIEKMTNQMESNAPKPVKKFNVVNSKNLDKQADEL